MPIHLVAMALGIAHLVIHPIQTMTSWMWTLESRGLAKGSRKSLCSLFEQEGAKIIVAQREYPGSVVISLRGMCLEITRHMDIIYVRVSPEHSPDVWHELDLVLAFIEGGAIQHKAFSSLDEVAKRLMPQLSNVRSALAESNFATLDARLQAFYGGQPAFLRAPNGFRRSQK